jgi:hypothetical protein
MRKQSLILFAGVFAAVSLSACGGNSCSSACSAADSCYTRITGEVVPPEVTTMCTEECKAETCAARQSVIDCYVGTPCGTDLAAYEDALTACQVQYCPAPPQ